VNKKSLVKNAADPGQVKSANQKEKFNKVDELKDMRDLLLTPNGLRVLTRYLNFCGVFKTSFTGNSETFFNEGMRSVGLKLLTDIEEADVTAIGKIFKIKGEL
jgi:hypothetical protein